VELTDRNKPTSVEESDTDKRTSLLFCTDTGHEKFYKRYFQGVFTSLRFLSDGDDSTPENETKKY